MPVWWQLPLPSQAPAGVAIPPEHVADPHTFELDAAWQIVGSLPSHVGPHVVPTPVPLHFRRVPWGAEPGGVTEQMPTFPAMSHA